MADPTVEIVQFFSMKSDRRKCSLQLCRGPDGTYMVVVGDLTQPNGGSFVGSFWTKGDLKQLRNALSREIADG